MNMLKLAQTSLVSLCLFAAACATGTFVPSTDASAQGRNPRFDRCAYGATALTNSTSRPVLFQVGGVRGMSSVYADISITVPPQTRMTSRDFPDGQPAQLRVRRGEVTAVVVTPEGGVPSRVTIIRQMPEDCNKDSAANFIFAVTAERRGSTTVAVVESGVPRGN